MNFWKLRKLTAEQSLRNVGILFGVLIAGWSFELGNYGLFNVCIWLGLHFSTLVIGLLFVIGFFYLGRSTEVGFKQAATEYRGHCKQLFVPKIKG